MGDAITVVADRDLQSPFAVNYSPNLIDQFSRVQLRKL
jgi:hypothetical protein